MIVLVTGGGGFLGRHVARRFADEGWLVIGCGNSTLTQFDEWELIGFSHWYEGELSPELLCSISEVPDLIVHCAGGGSVGASVQEPYKDFRRTVVGTASVLDFMRLRAPNCHLIYPSSPAVQGLHDETPIRTNDSIRPVSPYGFHKHMAEELCRSYEMAYGLRSTIVRFFSVYGVGLRKQLLWDACKKLNSAENHALFWGDGLETRDWVHVSDAVELILLIAKMRQNCAKVLNCGSGQPVCIKEVLNLLREMLGVDTSIEFNGQVKSGDPRYYLADLTEATAIGWAPQVKLESGLRQYVEWFGENHD